MRKCLFILVVLCFTIGALPLKASKSDVERDLKKSQKELSVLISKQKKAKEKQNQLQNEYAENLIKIEEKEDKPKSISYKNALKKKENLAKKLENNSIILSQLDREIDSLYNLIQTCSLKLQKSEKEEIKLNKEETQTEIILLSNENIKNESDTTQVINEELQKSDKDSSEYQSLSDEEEDKVVVFYILGFLFILALPYMILDYRRSHRCPNCGKWFTLESEGENIVKQYSHDGKEYKKGARKKYRCTNCGHRVQYISWFSKK